MRARCFISILLGAALFWTGCSSDTADKPPSGGTNGDNNGDTSGSANDSNSNQSGQGGSGSETNGENNSAGTDSTPSADAGTQVPSTDFGPCDAPGLLACDDFEQGQLDEATWDFVDFMKPPSLTMDAKHGSYAIEVKSSREFAIPKAAFPAPNNKVYVRAWMNLAAGTAGSHGWYIVAGQKNGDQYENGMEIRLGKSEDMLDLNWMPVGVEGGASEITRFSNGRNNDEGPPGDGGIRFGPDEWHCIEALFDAEGDEFRLWVDSEAIEEMTVTQWVYANAGPFTGDWFPALDYVKFGGQNANPEVRFDDVAVGTQRIGCNQR